MAGRRSRKDSISITDLLVVIGKSLQRRLRGSIVLIIVLCGIVWMEGSSYLRRRVAIRGDLSLESCSRDL